MARPRFARAGWPALVALGAGLLAGCSYPFVSPLGLPPYRQHTPADFDATWNALIRALAVENVPLRTVARDSGIIASDDFVTPVGVYADCGRLGDVPIEGEALIAFTVFVSGARNGTTTEIQVNANMRTQAYRRGDWGRLKTDQAFRCVSTGRWEANLLDTVRRLLQEPR
jgi:hypothetical protein